MNGHSLELVSFLLAATAAFVIWRVLKPGMNDLRVAPIYRAQLVFMGGMASLFGIVVPLGYFGPTGAPTAVATGFIGVEFGIAYTRRTLSQNRRLNRQAVRSLARFWRTKR